MTTPTTPFTPPSLATLTARFLAKNEDVGTVEASVEPHEVASAFVAYPKAAWNEAVAAAKLLGVTDSIPVPGDWAAFVQQAGPVDCLPLAIGHFPQQVSDVSRLLEGKRTTPSVRSNTWTAKPAKLPILNHLLNAADARLSGRWSEAEKQLADAEKIASTDAFKTLVKNERAALALAKGDTATATKLWTELSPTAVGAFNLGVTAMMQNKADAKKWFTEAAERLPETSSWHHLAKMYLALAST
jgi:hypothetical protein